MKASLFFIISTLIFLGSCTIEKRLYNKGWHVEFNRKPKAVKEDKTVVVPISPTRENPSHALVGEVQISDSVPVDHLEKVIETADLSVHSIPHSEQKTLPRATHSRQQTKTAEMKSGGRKQAESRPWSREERKRSITIVTVLLVLAILGIVAIYLGLQTNLMIVEAIGLVLLMVLLGIMALVLLISLLAMLATRSQEEINDARRQAIEDEKAREQMTPEEQKRIDKAVKRKNSETTIAVGFVLVVLILLLFVAI